MRWLPPGVDLVGDVAPAGWVVTALKPWDPGGARLESFAPPGFDAYARVFHPAGDRYSSRQAIPDPNVVVRWGDLARSRGVDLSPDVGFAEIADLDADDVLPMNGNLPAQTCDALVDALRSHTGTPDLAWFCLWEGNGAFWSGSHSSLLPPGAPPEEIGRELDEGRAQDRLLRATPRVQAHQRAYFLFRGPLGAACRFEPAGWYSSPSIWWPDDRAWIVVTEVDGYSSYVGGSEAAIRDVLGSPDIEAIGVSLDTHMDPEDRRPWWR